MSGNKDLDVRIDAFSPENIIPVKYTGWGEDISPEIRLLGLQPDAVSVAIVMDDLDVPFVGTYNHWVIWNLPPQDVIPAGIPHEEAVMDGKRAVQGMGYGKRGYRGPKPPKFLKKEHRYVFQVYVLDCELNLSCENGKKELLSAMEGHVRQYGCVQGVFGNRMLKD